MTKKKLFNWKLVNDVYGDPAVLVELTKGGEHLLFDLGDIGQLTQKEILKIRYVLVSHTHMDHFIGFDRLLRCHLPHRKKLHFFGPKGLASQIRSRLLSYTWNLIDADQICINVTELEENKACSFNIGVAPDFSLISYQRGNEFVLSDATSLSFAILDHKGIDSIAYRLESSKRYRVKEEAILALGLKPSDWVGKLQSRALKSELIGQIEIEGKLFEWQSLADLILEKQQPDSLVYVTDIEFSQRNLERLMSFQPSNSLVIESSFRQEDRARAFSKAHLTSRQAALIASILGIEVFEVFHISGIYGEEFSLVVEEANKLFHQFQSMNTDEKAAEISRELSFN